MYRDAAGNDASPGRLARSWSTEIEVTPQGADGGSGEVEEGEDYIISDRYPENPARAARGIIRTNAEQRVDFTNSGRVGSLRISKTVAGDQATDEDREKEFSFTVTLKDADGNPLKGTYPYTGDTTAAGVSAPADGKLTLDGSGSGTVMLGHGQSITVGNIPKGTAYAVSESGDDGFSVVVDDDTDGDGAAEGTVAENAAAAAVFTNIRQSALVFTKVDAEDLKTPLPGAEFTLYRLDCKSPGHDHSSDTVSGETGCWRKENSVTGGTDGKVSFGNLARESVYCLAETKAPDGFALPEGQWRITTNADGEIQIEAAGTQDGRRPTACGVDEGAGARRLPNGRAAPIPPSGGWGVVLYRACGGLLMLAAVGILAVRRLRGRHLDS